MTADVFAFPPVSVTGWSWTIDAPVSRSTSLINGRRYVSAAERSRRMASLVVTSRGSGSGYMESLKRLLAGGVGLVRLRSMPINTFADAVRENALRQYRPDLWVQQNNVVPWLGAPPVAAHFYRTILTGVISTYDGWARVTVTGLPPMTLAARAGEFVTIYASDDDTTGSTAQVVRDVMADETGTAVIRLHSALAYSGRIDLGTRDTAVFEALDMPSGAQGVAAPASYAWSFREVFADEVGGFVERNPWI